MLKSQEPTQTRGPAKGELPVAAAAFALLILLRLALTGGFAMFGRDLWQDEVYTNLLAADPSLAHSMIALLHGSDTQGPTFYLCCRFFGKLLGGVSPVTLRLMACLSVWSAVVGVYAVLRLAVDRISAIFGALIFRCHPAVMTAAFDAQAYGPQLAAAVWLCWALATPNRSWIRTTMLGVCSVLLCSLHYFGLAAWFAAVAGYWMIHRKDRALRLPDWCALMAGPLALAACLPFVHGHYLALGNTTWISRPLAGLGAFITGIAPPSLVATPVIYFLVAGVLHKLKPKSPSDSIAPLSALAALGMVPLAIIAFSLVGQPALMPRYAIAGVPALAVVAAWLIRRVPPRLARGLYGHAPRGNDIVLSSRPGLDAISRRN